MARVYSKADHSQTSSTPSALITNRNPGPPPKPKGMPHRARDISDDERILGIGLGPPRIQISGLRIAEAANTP